MAQRTSSAASVAMAFHNSHTSDTTPTSRHLQLHNGNAFTTHKRHYQAVHKSTQLTWPMLSSMLQSTKKSVQPPKEYYHNQPITLWKMTKALYGLRTSPKQ
eukprot:6462863-Amphidinium_carterae.1